ncbi:hypothetical protein [Kribbella sp. NPDC004536]|uniref:hypothetical protein n=1 Tax=Kribbella sp. NPDC004536 TaxID=3364106 RepID=UPI0036B22A0D
MNTDLEPPRVPPLSAAERARMRNQLMDRTRPAARHSVRRWAAPVVGVAAVGAVVAGTLVVTHKPPDDTAPAGTTAASPEAKVTVDLGMLPRGYLGKVTAACQFPGEVGLPQVVWTRRVRGITKDSAALVGVARYTGATSSLSGPNRGGTAKPGSGAAASTFKLGYRYCLERTPQTREINALSTVGRIEDKTWRAEPTARNGMVALGGSDGDFTNSLSTLQAWRLYRTHASVAKVEARYVLNGKTGPWTAGVVQDGFAYIEVQANGKFTVGQRLKTEVRAFDVRGVQVPVR